MATAISVEGLSKAYHIAHEDRLAHTSLRETLAGALRGWRGRRLQCEPYWALRDVDFTVEQGERIGIVGRNGAGKSTLLKLLSRITEPTSGRAVIRGRVASLLEVGTGFHPELTGRENIYLNGAVLNMRAREITRKFDEIVEFADIGPFLDTPVKRYSSGMFMRLAFAVAAHLEPEILLVDEVLAVGDAAFRKKCLGKMGDIADSGRTVLFVSHNMAAVKQLCERALWLDGGKVVACGEAGKIVDRYLTTTYGNSARCDFPAQESKTAQIRHVRLLDSAGQETADFAAGDLPVLEVGFDINRHVSGVEVSCVVYSIEGSHLFSTQDGDLNPEVLSQRKPGHYVARVTLPFHAFNVGTYFVTVGIGRPGIEAMDRQESVSVTLHDGGGFGTLKEASGRAGLLLVEAPWNYMKKADD